MNDKLHIALLDDHPLIVKGLLALLRKWVFVSKVEGFTDVAAFNAYITQHKVDVAILDLRIKGEEVGYDLAAHIKKNVALTQVLIYTAHTETPIVNRCVNLGVDAYVSKDSDVSELKNALQQLMHEQTYFSSDIQDKIGSTGNAHNRNGAHADNEPLTSRELEILTLICKGNDYRQISEKMYISPNTVRKHRQNIMQKTHTHNMQQLYSYALERGLINSN
jgi:DNA-binding NarL/FixJ family response regulator